MVASTWLQTSYKKSFPTDAFGSGYGQEESNNHPIWLPPHIKKKNHLRTDTFFNLPDLLNHRDLADLFKNSSK